MSKRSFGLFRKMCGTENLKNVSIVTTKWSKVTSREGNARVKELAEVYFKSALDEGAKMDRYDDTKASADQLLRTFFGNAATALSLQKELVDESKPIFATEAGIHVEKDLNELIKRAEEGEDGDKSGDSAQTNLKLEQYLRHREEILKSRESARPGSSGMSPAEEHDMPGIGLKLVPHHLDTEEAGSDELKEEADRLKGEHDVLDTNSNLEGSNINSVAEQEGAGDSTENDTPQPIEPHPISRSEGVATLLKNVPLGNFETTLSESRASSDGRHLGERAPSPDVSQDTAGTDQKSDETNLDTEPVPNNTEAAGRTSTPVENVITSGDSQSVNLASNRLTGQREEMVPQKSQNPDETLSGLTSSTNQGPAHVGEGAPSGTASEAGRSSSLNRDLGLGGRGEVGQSPQPHRDAAVLQRDREDRGILSPGLPHNVAPSLDQGSLSELEISDPGLVLDATSSTEPLSPPVPVKEKGLSTGWPASSLSPNSNLSTGPRLNATSSAAPPPASKLGTVFVNHTQSPKPSSSLEPQASTENQPFVGVGKAGGLVEEVETQTSKLLQGIPPQELASDGDDSHPTETHSNQVSSHRDKASSRSRSYPRPKEAPANSRPNGTSSGPKHLLHPNETPSKPQSPRSNGTTARPSEASAGLTPTSPNETPLSDKIISGSNILHPNENSSQPGGTHSGSTISGRADGILSPLDRSSSSFNPSPHPSKPTPDVSHPPRSDGSPSRGVLLGPKPPSEETPPRSDIALSNSNPLPHPNGTPSRPDEAFSGPTPPGTGETPSPLQGTSLSSDSLQDPNKTVLDSKPPLLTAGLPSDPRNPTLDRNSPGYLNETPPHPVPSKETSSHTQNATLDVTNSPTHKTASDLNDGPTSVPPDESPPRRSWWRRLCCRGCSC